MPSTKATWTIILGVLIGATLCPASSEADESGPYAILAKMKQAYTEDEFAKLAALTRELGEYEGHASAASVIHDRAVWLRRRSHVLHHVRPRLEQNPEDHVAHLIMGRFYAFEKRDWETGLSHLARSEHDRLQPLAAADRKGPVTPEEMVRLADGWWDVAHRQRGVSAAAVRARAAKWYHKAFGELEGEKRKRVADRIIEHTKRAYDDNNTWNIHPLDALHALEPAGLDIVFGVHWLNLRTSSQVWTYVVSTVKVTADNRAETGLIEGIEAELAMLLRDGGGRVRVLRVQNEPVISKPGVQELGLGSGTTGRVRELNAGRWPPRNIRLTLVVEQTPIYRAFLNAPETFPWWVDSSLEAD